MRATLGIIALAIVVIIWAIAAIQTRQKVQRARQRGLWPPLDQIPTDADVERLAEAGERVLAIKMCRQIHGMGLAEAKAVVERMAGKP
jgi:ribosomal protein L7/L12